MINSPTQQLALFESAIESIPDEQFTPAPVTPSKPEPEYTQPRLPLRYFDGENAEALESYLRGEDDTRCEHEIYATKLQWGSDEDEAPIVWDVTYSYLRPMEVAIFNSILAEPDPQAVYRLSSDSRAVHADVRCMKCNRRRHADDEYGGAPGSKRKICVHCERHDAANKTIRRRDLTRSL